MFGLCIRVSGPLAGPRQLRIEEQQNYGRDQRDSSADIEGHQSTLNSSKDRIHLMISWKVRNFKPWFFLL